MKLSQKLFKMAEDLKEESSFGTMKILAYDIVWDIDEEDEELLEEDGIELPEEIIITINVVDYLRDPEDFREWLLDEISEDTGWSIITLKSKVHKNDFDLGLDELDI